MAQRSPRRRTSSRRTTRAPRVIRISAAPAPSVGVGLLEDPHSHIVCRVCGRIQRIELTELDRHFLTEMASRRPDGWSVDGISFSLTGACRRCREGPARR